MLQAKSFDDDCLCHYILYKYLFDTLLRLLGRLEQSVTCLTADPGVVSLIPAWSHTLMEIDHEIISTVILLSIDSRGVVSYKRKYMHEVLVNCLVC